MSPERLAELRALYARFREEHRKGGAGAVYWDAVWSCLDALPEALDAIDEEREACAKEIETRCGDGHEGDPSYPTCHRRGDRVWHDPACRAEDVAAIRARGQVKP